MNEFDVLSFDILKFDIFSGVIHWCPLALEGAAGSPFPALPLPVLIAIMFGLFYFIVLRPQQGKERDHRSMLDNLKEKDRVVTIGGIHGVVTNVQREREEVTIRVDESTGTKMKINISAISRLVTDQDKNKDTKTK